MSLTPEQLDKMSQGKSAAPDALKRGALNDCREGYFFVTLTTKGEAPILCIVERRGVVEYTELGKKVKEAIATIPESHIFTEVIGAEMMPERLCMLLSLRSEGSDRLGDVIADFIGRCSHAYWETLNLDCCKDQNMPDMDCGRTFSLCSPALFVCGSNDVEPVTEENVKEKMGFLRNLAEKRLTEGDRHGRFKVHRLGRSGKWIPEVALQAIAADRSFLCNKDKCMAAINAVAKRLNSDTKSLFLDWVGNRELMGSERKLPLVCHRTDYYLFDKQKSAVLAAARDGWIIVSAFASGAEREIRRVLLAEQLPFIEVMDNGFSDSYKPKGSAFYACAENRLVEVTCWKYVYQKKRVMNREMCLVMNQLVRVISGREDDWWKTQIKGDD